MLEVMLDNMDNMMSNDLLDMEKMADDAASVGICGSYQQSLQAGNYTDPMSAIIWII